jgi:hypothetical protein
VVIRFRDDAVHEQFEGANDIAFEAVLGHVLRLATWSTVMLMLTEAKDEQIRRQFLRSWRGKHERQRGVDGADAVFASKSAFCFPARKRNLAPPSVPRSTSTEGYQAPGL